MIWRSPTGEAPGARARGARVAREVDTRQAGKREKVEAYWYIGDALQRHFRDHRRSEYVIKIVRNLSKDIGLWEITRWEILHFRRALPILYTCKEFGCFHIRARY